MATNGHEPPSPPTTDHRQRSLLTLQSVKRELADTIRKVRDGSLDTKRAGQVIYGCSVLAELIKAADVETLLKRLEARVGGGEREEDELVGH